MDVMWKQMTPDEEDSFARLNGDSRFNTSGGEKHNAPTKHGGHGSFYLRGQGMTKNNRHVLKSNTTCVEREDKQGRLFETLDPKKEEVLEASHQMFDMYCELADPEMAETVEYVNGSPVITPRKRKLNLKASLNTGPQYQRLSFLVTKPGALKQHAHCDQGYYSCMVSRDHNTRLYMYTTSSGGTLVEFEVVIPPGFVVFFRGDSCVHAGAEYRKPIGDEDLEDRSRTRVFGYVHGWSPSYELMDATGEWSVQTICAQQGVDPHWYKGDDEVASPQAH